MNGPKSIDLASFSVLASRTGGDLYFYPGFDLEQHSEKIHYELFRILTRTQGMEVVMKLRTSSGFSAIEYMGGFGTIE